MNSKKLFKIIGILMLISILALSACQSDVPEAPTEEAPAEEVPAEEVPADGFKVALLLPGSANDQSWNQLAFDGVMAAQENLGIEVAFSENVDHTVEVDAIRDYAEQGYDVIIGHSGSYEEAMVTLGPEYPDVHMVIIAGSKGGGENVTAVDTAPWQVGYAEGYLAGLTTENDYVAFITAGEGLQVMNNFVGSWKDGVNAANPDATACVIYVPDWGDVAAAREAATALHEEGADVIMHELNRATQGVIDACNELGCLTNVRLQEQIDEAPNVSIMGVDYAWNDRFTAVIQKIMNDELPGGAFFFGFNTPGEGFNFFYGDDEFNSNIVTEEMMTGFQTGVVNKFIADPLLDYSVDQAKGGCEIGTGEVAAAEDDEMMDLSGFKVALLLPGSANDQSWNQLAFDGVMAAQENLGIEVAFSENVDHTVEVDAIRDYAEQGYDVIIGHSGSYEEAMVTLGPEYPDVHMVIIAGSKGGGENVTAVDTAPWQVGYAEGYLAGLTTENDYVAFITAGEGLQVMNNFVGSWKDGVNAANPDATACVIYVPDWGDVAAAREAATALHEEGADVIMHELNRATQGVIDACNELGCLTNVRLQEQIDEAPNVSIMGVDYAWNDRFTAVIQKIANGELPGGAFFFGFNTPGEGFNFFYGDDEFNSNIVTEEMMTDFQTGVVNKFIADPLLDYSVDQAKGGCE